jgi:hypothetical protein
MLKKSSIAVAILLILFVVFRVFIVDSCSSKDDDYTEVLSSNNAYVGDQSCKKCHVTEHHQWKQSDHYMSMLPANDSTVKGDFNNVTFTADGITSKFFKKALNFSLIPKEMTGKITISR